MATRLITNALLQGYVSQQALMLHKYGSFETVGPVLDIQLSGGAIEVQCTWLGKKKRRQRKWRLANKQEPTMLLLLDEKINCTDMRDGEISIKGSNGTLILTPTDKEFPHERIVSKP